MYNNTKKVVLLCLLASTFGFAHAKAESQAGGLPALAEQVANLQALVASLQADVTGSAGW
ncbi:MAG: hypothetical protein U5O39_05005 [Gammaproteobacteria bacterium]|nr:hypothetical protein [Gammaproteobacteria bacterium]